MIRFNSKQEKLDWLKATAVKIKEMDIRRNEAIMTGKHNDAFRLLKGIQFAKREFAAVSKTLKKDYLKNGSLA